MSRVDELAAKYRTHIALPWLSGLAAPQRIIFLSYEPADELKVRLLTDEFETATKTAGHKWILLDVENLFAEWMSSQEYKEAYFENPELFTEDQVEPFGMYVAEHIVKHAGDMASMPEAVVAVSGTGSLFGLASVHKVVEKAATSIAGRLVVFFPGSCSDNHFRLLNGHNGEGYHATVITA